LTGSLSTRFERARVATSVKGVRMNMYFPTSTDCRGRLIRTLPSMKRTRLRKMYGERMNFIIEIGSKKSILRHLSTPILNRTVPPAPMITRPML